MKLTDEQRTQGKKTVKTSIIANAIRIIELLEAEEERAELINKMHELRRDTIRLEGILKNLFRTCRKCQKEFKAKNSYEFKCIDCYYADYRADQGDSR